jgi:hypothetical protein
MSGAFARIRDRLVADSQELASLWRNRGKHQSKVGTILEDVMELASPFPSFKVVYAQR